MLDPLYIVFLLDAFVFVLMPFPRDTMCWPVIYDCGFSLS